jgi:predicted Zn-dependent peptidase
MRRSHHVVVVLLVLLTAGLAGAADLEIAHEVFTLPNGLTVILHEDHTLPRVTVNTWFYVGSRDDPAGRSGFAHLFEHLMFMGTERVPGSGYDDIMEAGGGANNASTGMDRTNYYIWAPSSLLPTLIWLEADRLDGLGRAMTQDKLDLQRQVVLNERRENYENAPYGQANIIIPKTIYPPNHPYHLSGIGEPEHLEAATLQDVVSFFDTYYVPSNASLVVAGDFDPEAVRELIWSTFGTLPLKPAPEPATAAPVTLDRERRRVVSDRVDAARLYLVWPSPPLYAEGDAELDLVASILADGPSSRLYRRLVIEDELAQEVAAYQASEGLGSLFHIVATATTGADLEGIKLAILDEIHTLQETGPTAVEMERVQAAVEADFLRGMERLVARADSLNAYRHAFGDPDSFARDLARWTQATAAGVQQWSRRVLTNGRLDLRILPDAPQGVVGDLDVRPADWPARSYAPPVPDTFTLDNGIPVALVSRPGTGLFAGTLLSAGGERLIPADDAGLASLAAVMLTSGAGSRTAGEYADAVTSLGAEIDSRADWHAVTMTVRGLSSRLRETLDLFADAVLRPRLDAADFERERRLALERIRTRGQNPMLVGFLGARAMVYGHDDPRGRPTSGYEATVSPLELSDLRSVLPHLLNPSRARLVFAGDVDAATLKAALDDSLGSWSAPAPKSIPAPPPRVAADAGMVLIDRPQAPQTTIVILRPIPAPESGPDRLGRRCVNTVFGGTFTSRLMRNLREDHGYTYHAGSALPQRGDQFELIAYSAVQADATAAALTELQREFNRLSTGDLSAAELGKAISTVRYELVATGESTASLAATLASLASDGRPLNSVTTDLASLGEVTLDQVNAIARSDLFDWDQLRIVLVGDASEVTRQLAEAGFPEPRMADSEGRPVGN